MANVKIPCDNDLDCFPFLHVCVTNSTSATIAQPGCACSSLFGYVSRLQDEDDLINGGEMPQISDFQCVPSAATYAQGVYEGLLAIFCLMIAIDACLQIVRLKASHKEKFDPFSALATTIYLIFSAAIVYATNFITEIVAITEPDNRIVVNSSGETAPEKLQALQVLGAFSIAIIAAAAFNCSVLWLVLAERVEKMSTRQKGISNIGYGKYALIARCAALYVLFIAIIGTALRNVIIRNFGIVPAIILLLISFPMGSRKLGNLLLQHIEKASFGTKGKHQLVVLVKEIKSTSKSATIIFALGFVFTIILSALNLTIAGGRNETAGEGAARPIAIFSNMSLGLQILLLFRLNLYARNSTARKTGAKTDAAPSSAQSGTDKLFDKGIVVPSEIATYPGVASSSLNTPDNEQSTSELPVPTSSNLVD